MTRYLFAPEPIFTTPSSTAVTIGANQPFELYDSRVGGAKIIDCTAPDGVTTLPLVNGRFVADGNGQPPAFRGPSGVVSVWLDGGAGTRYQLLATDLLDSVLQAAISWLVSGIGTGSGAALDDTSTGAQTTWSSSNIASKITALLTRADFLESVEDRIGGMVAAAGGVYDDTAGTIALPSGATNDQTSTSSTVALSAAATKALITGLLSRADFLEAVEDRIGALVQAAGGTYNDTAGTITLPTGSAAGAVRYDAAQNTLTATQKAQARSNSGALADGPARFHVADYGVLGDGTTNDYPGFAAATAAAVAFVQSTSRPAIVDFSGMGTVLFGSGASRTVAQQHSAGTGSSVDATIAAYGSIGLPIPPALPAQLTFHGPGTVVKGSASCVCFAFPDRTNDYQVWQNLRFDTVTWDDANVGTTAKGHCIWGNMPSGGVKMRYTSLQDLEAVGCVVLNAATDTTSGAGAGTMSRSGFYWSGDHNGPQEATQTFTRRIKTTGGAMYGGDQLYAFYCTVADRYRAGGATLGGVNHLHTDIKIGDGWRHINAVPQTVQRFQTSVYLGGSTLLLDDFTVGEGYSENIGDDAIEIGGALRGEIVQPRCKDPFFNLVLFRNTSAIDSVRQDVKVRRPKCTVTTALSGTTGAFAAPYAWIADDRYLQVSLGGTVSGGTFTLTIPLNAGSVTTAAIPWNATAAQIAAAIDAVVPAAATAAPNGGVTGYAGAGALSTSNPLTVVLVKQNLNNSVGVEQRVTVTSSLTGTNPIVSVGIAPIGSAFGRFLIEDGTFSATGLTSSKQGRTDLLCKGPGVGVPILGLSLLRPRLELSGYVYDGSTTNAELFGFVHANSLYGNWPLALSVRDGSVRAAGCNLAAGTGSGFMFMVGIEGFATLGEVDGLETDFSGSWGGTWGHVIVGRNVGAGIRAFVKRLKPRGQPTAPGQTAGAYTGLRVGTEGQVAIAQLSESDFSVYGDTTKGLVTATTGTYGTANAATVSAFANLPTSVAAGTIGSGGGSGAVASVAGKTGAVTLASTDLTDAATLLTATSGDARYASQSALNSIAVPRRYPKPRYTLFPRVGAWTASGTGVTITTGSSNSPMGTPSVVVSSPGTSAVTKLARFTNTASTDMTGKMFGFWLRIPDMTHASSLTLYLYDSTGTAYFQFNVQVNATKNIHPGEWAEFVIPWAPAATNGSPVRSDIRQARLNLQDDGAGTALTWELGDQCFTVPEPAAFPNGVVSFCFDDSYDLSLAQPKLASYGIPATLFPILDRLDLVGKLATADARTWVETLGWEVAGHAATLADHVSLSTLSSSDQVANLARLRAAMNATGFVSPVYAQPNAAADAVSDANIRQFFSASRGGSDSNALESLPAARPVFLRSLFAGSGTTTAQLQAFADKALAAKGWAIITFHTVVASAPDSLGITQANFNTVIDYIAGLAVEKLTISDVLGRLSGPGIADNGDGTFTLSY